MRRISTGVEHLQTTDDIADAIVTYATALARASTADAITIPIVRADGGADTARMLLGPASQLTIVPDGTDEVELPGASQTLEDLQRRLWKLQPAVEDEPEDAEADAFPDFDRFG